MMPDDATDNLNGANAAAIQHPQQLAADQLAMACENFFRVTAFGLCATNPTLKPEVLWEAIAAGMGATLSLASKTPDVRTTLALRGRITEIIGKAIRKYPAMDMTPANVNLAVAPQPRN